jgi:hypothetical protein
MKDRATIAVIFLFQKKGKFLRQLQEDVFNSSLKLELSQEEPGAYWILINDGKRIWISKVMKN